MNALQVFTKKYRKLFKLISCYFIIDLYVKDLFSFDSVEKKVRKEHFSDFFRSYNNCIYVFMYVNELGTAVKLLNYVLKKLLSFLRS